MNRSHYFYFSVKHATALMAEFRELPDEVRATWLDLMCLASMEDGTFGDWGYLPSIKQIALTLQLPLQEAERRVAILEGGGWIDNTDGQRYMHDWHEHQGAAESKMRSGAADRQKQYRERKKTGQINLAEALEDEAESGPEQIELDGIESRAADRHSWRDAAFEIFWAESWKRGSKLPAHKSYRKAAKTEEIAAIILEAVKKQRPHYLSEDPKYRPHMVTWINQERWRDEPDAPQVGGPSAPVPTNHSAYKPYVPDWKDEEAA